MTGIILGFAGLITAMIASELALGRTKLQTGLSRALAAWAGVYLVFAYPVFHYGNTGIFAFTVLWGGSFLSWFGVRSHIESSILLRMLYLLRRGKMTEQALLGEYAALYGEAVRREELLRGGMAARGQETLTVTPKGKTILAVVARLR